MTYVYRCLECGEETEIIKSAKHCDDPETCACGGALKMIFRPQVFVSFGTFKSGWYPTFGKTLENQRELKNELARIKGEENRELVEVGNENIEPKKPKVDWNKDQDKAVAELRKVLHK